MFVPITKDSYISAERVHSILPQEFIQFRRVKKIFQGNDVIGQMENDETKGTTNLIDITYGKSVETIIYMDSGHLILSAVDVGKVIEKVKKGRRGEI
ncbi:MAG TPA: DUF370 domain-containing protein [Tepiditoga sp.]|nr:DUF370 domain-containing protein [Tepiditoga sp.]